MSKTATLGLDKKDAFALLSKRIDERSGNDYLFDQKSKAFESSLFFGLEEWALHFGRLFTPTLTSRLIELMEPAELCLSDTAPGLPTISVKKAFFTYIIPSTLGKYTVSDLHEHLRQQNVCKKGFCVDSLESVLDLYEQLLAKGLYIVCPRPVFLKKSAATQLRMIPTGYKMATPKEVATAFLLSSQKGISFTDLFVGRGRTQLPYSGDFICIDVSQDGKITFHKDDGKGSPDVGAYVSMDIDN